MSVVERDVAEFEAQSGIVPIAVREDLTVRIQGLPYDLTEKEARKIAAVILAYATPEAEIVRGEMM